jgi:fido (protein-threonine AMPylation protein)
MFSVAGLVAFCTLQYLTATLWRKSKDQQQKNHRSENMKTRIIKYSVYINVAEPYPKPEVFMSVSLR